MKKSNDVLVIDTSGLISLLIENDSNHSKAITTLQKTQATFVIPSDVYTETINTLGKKFNREIAFEAALFINQAKSLLIIESFDVYEQALTKFNKSKGAPSFTDCIVMAMADKYNTEKIFGFDACFAKNNYTIPLN